MDTSMWQTTSQIHFLHSSNKWLSPMLSCGEHGTSLSIRAFPRLRFCRRSWRPEINIRWSLVLFRKQNICTNLLDVQEANLSVSQFHGIWFFFAGCWFVEGRSTFALDVWDMVIEVLRTTQGVPKPSSTSFGETGSIPKNTPEVNHALTQNVDLSNVDHVSVNAHLFEKESQVYIFEDNEAVIKMIIKGRSPTMRHVNNS